MTEISIPDALGGRIEDRITNTDFESVDEYSEFVLSEVMNRIEHASEQERESTVSREEVENRLQSLGYLEE